MENNIYKEAEGLYHKMCEHVDFLEKNAETGFDLTNTKEYVKGQLEALGLDVREYGKCGLGACIEGDAKGKTFLLRADMDALLGIDPYEPDRAIHACGHHFHTTMLLGAAEILSGSRLFSGTVKLMFQGAEEILEGASDMISNGILENPAPDGAMMVHVMTGVNMPVGSVIVSPGGISAPAADFFRVTVMGKGAHGALSHQGIDTISAAAHIIIALNQIKAKETGINQAMGLSIGKISAGGAANALPQEVVFEGSLRSFDENLRERVRNRICEISENIGKAFMSKVEVSFLGGCPALKNDEKLSRLVNNWMNSILDEKKVINISELGGGMSGGSEDFSYISQRIPSVMVAVSAGDINDGYKYPLHNPNVCFDKRALISGAAAYAGIALKFLNSQCI